MDSIWKYDIQMPRFVPLDGDLQTDVLGGCCKVAWKLVLGIAGKDLRWMNKPFVPMQAAGFLLMLISVIVGFGAINWAG